mgnify:CR=1 FL=1
MERSGSRLFLAPGRLTGASEQTCATVEVDGQRLTFEALSLEGRSLVRQETQLQPATAGRGAN